MSTPRYRSAPPSRSGSAISVANATTPSRPDWTSAVAVIAGKSSVRPVSADLLFRPALELATLIRGGELTATELVTAALERIDELQPDINAFTHVAHAEALETAAAIGPGDRRPFAGVPIAVKDNR